MYIMYVDESGDTGLAGSPTTHFVLSGLVIHESRWREFVTQISAFRKTMKSVYDLPVRAEIHAAEYVRKPPVDGMSKRDRLAILRNFLDEIAKMDFISVTTVVVDKTNKPENYDVFDNAWMALFQRFENTMNYGNFPGGFKRSFGMVMSDNTDGQKITRLLRRMSAYNPIPSQYGAGSRMLPISRIIEDPHQKDSKASYFIQACDACAYFAMQEIKPNQFIKKSGAHNYFNRLSPIFNKKASNSNERGVVIL